MIASKCILIIACYLLLYILYTCPFIKYLHLHIYCQRSACYEGNETPSGTQLTVSAARCCKTKVDPSYPMAMDLVEPPHISPIAAHSRAHFALSLSQFFHPAAARPWLRWRPLVLRDWEVAAASWAPRGGGAMSMLPPPASTRQHQEHAELMEYLANAINTSLNSLSVRKLLDLSCPYLACVCLPLLSLLCLPLLTLAYICFYLTKPCWALLALTGPYWALLGLTWT